MMKKIITRLSLLGLVMFFTFAISAPQSKSLRKSFYGWQNISGTCRNQRHEILMQRSQIPVTFKTDAECRVVSGSWIDYYTDENHYLAEDVTMDHVVSLKYAYDHGAKQWPKKMRSAFYNDEANLVLTAREVNASKNHYAPDKWLPDNKDAQCKYTEKWQNIANKYDLEIEEGLANTLRTIHSICTPGETRTPDHLVRSQALYPTELRAQ